MKRTLIFDIWGEWGHFRKYYTTTSPLTFSLMPPTAAMGVIGAILGLSKEENEYLHVLNEARTWIGIGVVQPIKKVMLGINLINTKGNVWIPKQRTAGARTQIRTEFLRDVRYRLFVSMEDDHLYTELVQRVREHRTHYTVSLGLSELLANFGYVDEVAAEKKQHEGEAVPLDSAVPLHLIRERGLPIVEGRHYGKERLPIVMDEARIVSAYEECLFDLKGEGVVAEVDYYWQGGPYRFLYLNESTGK